MVDSNLQDRAKGALLGAFIGDALALGPHWYYNIEEMRHDYGEWVNNYTDPKPGRYHSGLKAGQLSQSGYLLRMMMQSLADCGEYDEDDFCLKLESQLFPELDGSPMTGPGGYTSQSIRDAWRCRVKYGIPWSETGGHADTTEAIERTLVLAVRYSQEPNKMAETITSNTVLTQSDDTVVSMTVAYGAVLAMLVKGHALDNHLSDKLMKLVKTNQLPFHAVTSDNLQPPKPGDPDPPRTGRFASPDALLSPSYMAAAAVDPDIRIEPAWKVSIVYGMPCAIYHQLPAAYYLAARFHDNFESAVLHAVNGGGQNQARAILAGALTGAQVGYSGIPERFIKGLDNHQELEELSSRVTDLI